MPKDPAAVELGRKGGKARAKNLSATKRTEIARKAGKARQAKARARAEKESNDGAK